MKKFFAVIIFLIVSFSGYPQTERLAGMGNLNITIPDKYTGFNPYDFGGNPAWLAPDENESYLKIIPSWAGYNGDYRRYYDPAGENIYKLGFSGVKTLGEDGTFHGETSYEFNFRRDVPRSLRYNTYGGQAFFLADTTTGNFRYTGPSIKFSYSFEVADNLFAGASVRYRILDGLKNVYSRAEILYREIETNAGLAYRFLDNYVIGINYVYLNDQEKIESKSEDLLDVELFQYRGETYAISKRTQTVSQKIKGAGHKFSAQLFQNTGTIETGLTGSVSLLDQKVLIPYETTNQRFNEYEEGYSSFNAASASIRSRYRLNENLILALTGGYSRNYVWSKNTPKNKTLWEWEVNDINAGAGFSFRIIPSLLIGVEYNYSSLTADSSKYIDSRVSKVESADHFIKAGAEYQLMQNIFVRAGYNLSALERDIVFGGENISINKFTAGVGLYTFPSLVIDFQLEYGFYSGLPGNLKRSVFSGYTTIKLFTF